MQRRHFCRLIALAVPVGAAAQTPPDRTLSLYGVPLKDADVSNFVDAAQAAGARPLEVPPGSPPQFDVRDAGVPALERFTLLVHDDRVAMVRFVVKGYGQDNITLRGLLLGKYGVPMTVSPRPLPFAAFGARAAPRGGFQWRFADGMVLVYDHPRVGEVNLSYIDEARLEARRAGRVPGATPRVDDTVRDRF